MNLKLGCFHQSPLSDRMGIRFPLLVTSIMLMWTLSSFPCQAQPTPHKIIFDNQSGQNAVVKLLGSTTLVVKVSKQTKKTVHAAEGEYYVVVRYGDSEKDFTYTKSAPFAVTQSGDQYSIITFTLYRRRGGDFSVTPVSQEEFEKAGSPSSQSSSP